MNTSIPTQPKRILLCGPRSFAAGNLAEVLRRDSHHVTTFNRGVPGVAGDSVTGPVNALHLNPHLPEEVDTVINFIYLADEGVEENLAYIDSLVAFCNGHDVKKLIHISSCSVYPNHIHDIDGSTAAESNPARKGPYAAIKLMTEKRLLESSLRLHLAVLRPGLIVGPGMRGFIGGIGYRLPWNTIIGLGDPRSQIPLVSREAVIETVRIIARERPERPSPEFLLLADSASPTRREYLDGCRKVMGVGQRVRWIPIPIWLTAGAAVEAMTRIAGRRAGVLARVRSVCRRQHFNAKSTEDRLGIEFSMNWRQHLARAFDVEANFTVPKLRPLVAQGDKKVTFIGFGRIVRQRHLPALKRLGLAGTPQFFDIISSPPDAKPVVRDIRRESPSNSDLFIVATPGPVHSDAIESLRDKTGAILVEKPLCYSNEQLERWRDFARARRAPLLVCHSSRFRTNVLRMLEFISEFRPGKLHHASVLFQSPPVAQDSALWMRKERETRTLLLDYAFHTLDIAAMFASGEASIDACRHERNSNGETSLIAAHATFANCSLDLLLRQGLIRRTSQVRFDFQNYTVTLSFSPDTFVPHMSDDSFAVPLVVARQAIAWSVAKVLARLRGRDADHSHVFAINDALSDGPSQLEIERLRPTYDLLFKIAERVYS